MYMKMECTSGLQKLAVRHRTRLQVAIKRALHMSLVELRRKKLASLWTQASRLVKVHIVIVL